MKPLELWKYSGKNVRIITDDNLMFEGKAYDYTSAVDNTPEIASITIEHTELFENEIRSIEVLE